MCMPSTSSPNNIQKNLISQNVPDRYDYVLFEVRKHDDMDQWLYKSQARHQLL
jgi:hypothetical protein